VKYADSIWRELIRRKEPSGLCPNCLKREWSDAAHGWPKGYYPALRFEIDNGIPLCRPCHRRVDTDAHAKEQLWRRYIGDEAYDRLKLMAQARSRVDVGLTILYLERLKDGTLPKA
jgi:5-methylcytosine-specific restriction endonuclease McrA